MLFHNRIAACLSFLLVLAACGRPQEGYQRPVQITPSTPVPTLTPPPKTALPFTAEMRTNWLAGTPCAPPCWENIIPGKTPVSEAVRILNWHSSVRDVEFWTPSGIRDGMIVWRWNNTEHGSGQVGFIQQDTDPIITWIGVSFPEPFTLAEIRAAYGDPSHVVPYVGYGGLPGGSSGGSDFYEFTVVYLTQGFLLQTERDLFDPPTIDPQMALSSHVAFFPPTLAGLEAVSMRDYLLPWQGFLDFEDYCAQIRPIKDAQQRCPVVKP
jgi:hypothetical protein